MNDFVMPLVLGLDCPSLTMSLVNIASPSGDETALADSVEAALRTVAPLKVERFGDTVVARTDGGHAERVVVAGHLGTAASPEEDPLAYVEMGRLFGPGASDAKGALATVLKAVAAGGHRRDVTVVLSSGGPDLEGRDDLLRGDFALLAEPTGGAVVGEALDHPWAQQLIRLTDLQPVPGTSSAHGFERFASLGVPAVAFGPGDPSLAGSLDEFVPTAELTQCEFVLRQWLAT